VLLNLERFTLFAWAAVVAVEVEVALVFIQAQVHTV
jgi:hypothetical protein